MTTANGQITDDAILHGAGTGPTREQRRDASRHVLRHARNLEDLRLLLDALGLNTTQEDHQ